MYTPQSNDHNRLAIESQIAPLRLEAQAESYFAKLRPTVANPWQGATQRLTEFENALSEYDEQQAIKKFQTMLLSLEAVHGDAQAIESLRARLVEIQAEKKSLHLVRKNQDGYEVSIGAHHFMLNGAHQRQGQPTSDHDREERELVKQYRQLQADEDYVTSSISQKTLTGTAIEAEYPYLAAYRAQLDTQAAA